MTTTHPVSEVETYLADVRERLSDLPEEERAELLDDVATHVREVAEEHGSEHLRERLGPPDAFAAELRASAGYERVEVENDAHAPVVAPRRMAAVGRWSTALAPHWRRLAPAWWLARGALIAMVVLTAGDAGARLPWSMGTFSMYVLGIVVPAAVASYALGSRRPETQPPLTRRARIVFELRARVLGSGVLRGQVRRRP